MNEGQSIGHYKILRPLGKGGMGEVYLAEDTKLKREVALKVLPASLRTDPERLARFRREAEAAAKLNHPNIATIHALEEADNILFIVMEYVEGAPLSAKIPGDGMALDTFFDMFIPLSDALSHAHGQGRIHRDLKPDNIVVTDDGVPKILDFGLARIIDPNALQTLHASDTAQKTDAHAPTMTMKAEAQGVPSLTQGGQLMGTPMYMSPEQAEREETDARTDIFSFGVVMYEALTGHRPFEGKTLESIIGKILEAEPKAVTVWRPVTPHQLWWTIRKCLTKDRITRLQTAAELHAALLAVQQEVQSGTTLIDASNSSPDPRRGSPLFRPAYAVTLALLLATLAATTAWLLHPSPDPPLRKFRLSRMSTYDSPAISLDGRMIAYITDKSLWVQDLDQVEPRMIQGTEGAKLPFWSPGSDFIGYRDDVTLWKVPAQGGSYTPLCTLPTAAFGPSTRATWGAQGTIVVGRFPNLYEVSTQGGTPRLLAAPDLTRSEGGMFSPRFLPDGRTLLTNSYKTGDSTAVEIFTRRFIENNHSLSGYHKLNRTVAVEIVAQLENGERHALSLPDNLALEPIYSPTGHLIYSTTTGNLSSRTLWAVPFSISSLELEGDPFPIASEVYDYSVSSDGTLVYRNASQGIETHRLDQLAWVDRSGQIQGLIGQPQEGLSSPSLSPDGAFVGISAVENGNRDIWLHDAKGTGKSRMTFHDAGDYMPVWTPDGRWIIYNSEFGSGGRSDFYIMGADGQKPPFPLGLAPRTVGAPSWSPDGRYLAFHMVGPGTQRDLWYLPVRTTPDTVVMTSDPVLVYQTARMESTPAISPNGRYIAYASNISGRPEVYVRPFPSGRGEWQVSSNGGISPQWSRSGELFYLDYEGNNLMAVTVDMRSGRFIREPPQPLFSGDPIGVWFDRNGSGASQGAFNTRLFVPSPDGQRFVVIQNNREETTGLSSITIVQNWIKEFKSTE